MSGAVTTFLRSSIGRKQLIAVSGLLLCGFLVAHLAGNILLLVGSDAFNIYAYKLHQLGPLLYLAEAGLVVLFGGHLALAMKLTWENKVARGQKYYVKNRTGRGETIMSATMPYTGIILLIFLVLHIIQFKYGPYYSTEIDGVIMRDLYKTVIEYFASPLNTAWYVVAMFAAAVHTSHGFASSFQSFGWNHPKWMPGVKSLGVIYAIAVGGGFAIITILLHVKGA